MVAQVPACSPSGVSGISRSRNMDGMKGYFTIGRNRKVMWDWLASRGVVVGDGCEEMGHMDANKLSSHAPACSLLQGLVESKDAVRCQGSCLPIVCRRCCWDRCKQRRGWPALTFTINAYGASRQPTKSEMHLLTSVAGAISASGGGVVGNWSEVTPKKGRKGANAQRQAASAATNSSGAAAGAGSGGASASVSGECRDWLCMQRLQKQKQPTAAGLLEVLGQEGLRWYNW
eukprot:1161133-Pelagomonas_calceolata.AAC.13